MPRVFRVMREDKDGLPNVATSATGLGVRTGVDIDLDPRGNVMVPVRSNEDISLLG